MYKNSKIQILLPIIIAVSVVFGMYVYKTLFGNNLETAGGRNNNLNKIDILLQLVGENYVDTVSYDTLVENAIPKIIEQLDPHSIYIPAKELAEADEPIRGNFDGIGITFNLRNDTVYVIQPIQGGPSEKVGIRGGDRIIKVNDTIVAGIKITNEKIMARLKGLKGTKVNITVVRPGIDKELSFDIIRDKIPIHSIDVAYVAQGDVGYLKISRFSMTTYNEFMEKIALLKQQGMRKLILDLRGNGGGILQDAVRIVDEFLPAGKTIVYTEGKARPRFDYLSSARGFLQNNDVVIMIDEWSASASEILAGAIQDNDRGIIVGRRSFGKGLVQEPIYFNDGSALRLTVARYFTPTGRSIQKSYDNEEEYAKDLITRFEHGEFTQEDSIKHDESLKYTTPGGKTVYGGGGIMPDIFVPADTTRGSKFFSKVRQMGIDFQFTYDYADQNREKLKTYTDAKSLENYLHRQEIMQKFYDYAIKKGVKVTDAERTKGDKYLEKQIKALIVRNLIDETGFYLIMNEIDPTFLKALEVIKGKK
ncbi:MAG: S41 family peptidase [Salinivirgaceae bacterium]|nr:S41 family peptidase [Salinivirgaceae bacterium]MDD4746225.1 S41 family peptidase [Salinivirgaceae bacterium]MDY0279386.1 S41 family peptidase [Salinivirgaceae bacterium]